MSIIFSCKCGQPLRAKPETAGKKTKCPHCGAILVIPASAAQSVAALSVSGDSGIAIEGDWTTPMEGSSVSLGGNDPHAATTLIRLDNPSTDAGLLPDDGPGDAPAEGARRYKVLTPKDYGIPGKFNPGKLEETLNQLARQGWTVKSSVVINVPGHSGNHDELVVILER